MMDRRIVLGLIIVIVVAIAGFATLYRGVQYEPAVTITPPVKDVYVNFRNETSSSIFLVDSEATFGTFAADHIDPWDWRNGINGSKDAYRGDRFVSINGTVRNDYDQLLYFALDAHVYDRKGNQIGTLLRTSDRPEFLGAWMGLGAGHTGDFHLLLKCDKQYTAADIGGYDIILAWEPGPTPIP